MLDKKTHTMRKRFGDSELAAIGPEILPTHMEFPDLVGDDWGIDDFLPPGCDISQVSAVGKPREFQRFFARELMWQSDECPDFLVALSMAVRSVRIDPACLDARLLLADFAGGPADEYIEELRRIVALGEQDLGARFFEENRGRFWGVMETRPYMRARAKLAEELHKARRTSEAMAEYEALLSLNPNDNQGLRYPLLGCYLEEEWLEGARRLFRDYEAEGSAMFEWGRVLERYLADDLAGAVEALTQARRTNSHVEPFLTGKKKLPKSRPDFYEPHHVTEAILCMDEIGGAWRRHAEAIAWLKREHGSGNLFVEERQSKRIKGKKKSRFSSSVM
jgi:tetratricopeptide (TPR) repeat protein